MQKTEITSSLATNCIREKIYCLQPTTPYKNFPSPLKTQKSVLHTNESMECVNRLLVSNHLILCLQKFLTFDITTYNSSILFLKLSTINSFHFYLKFHLHLPSASTFLGIFKKETNVTCHHKITHYSGLL